MMLAMSAMQLYISYEICWVWAGGCVAYGMSL